MKKIIFILLVGLFFLIDSVDVKALEFNEVMDGFPTSEIMKTVLDTFQITLEEIEYRCSTSDTCTREEANQFVMKFYTSTDEIYQIIFDFTDEYISYKNPRATGSLEDIESFVYDIVDANFALGLMEHIANLHGYSLITEEEDKIEMDSWGSFPFTYEEDGVYLESSNNQIFSSIKLNYRDGFPGLLAKIEEIRNKQNNENQEENKNDIEESGQEEKKTPVQEIKNPSTGDMNVIVLVSLVVLFSLGSYISFKRIFS